MSKSPTLLELGLMKNTLEIAKKQADLTKKNAEAAKSHLLKIQLILAKRPLK